MAFRNENLSTEEYSFAEKECWCYYKVQQDLIGLKGHAPDFVSL